MATNETVTRIKSAWNPVLLLALIAFFLAFSALNAERRAFQTRPDVQVQWQGRDVRLYAGHEGDFVVTHLQDTRALPDGSHNHVTAELTDPVDILSQAAEATLGAAALATLDWRDADGRIAAPPTPGTPLRAVVSPSTSKPAAVPGGCPTTPGNGGLAVPG